MQLSQSDVFSEIERCKQNIDISIKKQLTINHSFSFEKLKKDIRTNGYCIFRTTTEEERKKVLASCDKKLGPRLQQNKLKSSTIMTVAPIADQHVFIHSRSFQPLHTDNAYTHNAPSIVILACIKPSPKGGESLLVPLTDVISYLSHHAPKVLTDLSDANAITYHRGKQEIKKSIFNSLQLNQIKFSFTVFAHCFSFPTASHKSSFIQLVKYLHTPKNQYSFKLQENDILILNNASVAHGREAFQGDRMLQRIWYNNTLT